MLKCPVCDAVEPKEPVAHETTGWTFCGDCLRRVLNRDYRPILTFSEFIRAVADERDRVQLAKRAETEPYPTKL